MYVINWQIENILINQYDEIQASRLQWRNKVFDVEGGGGGRQWLMADQENYDGSR